MDKWVPRMDGLANLSKLHLQEVVVIHNPRAGIHHLRAGTRHLRAVIHRLRADREILLVLCQSNNSSLETSMANPLTWLKWGCSTHTIRKEARLHNKVHYTLLNTVAPLHRITRRILLYPMGIPRSSTIDNILSSNRKCHNIWFNIPRRVGEDLRTVQSIFLLFQTILKRTFGDFRHRLSQRVEVVHQADRVISMRSDCKWKGDQLLFKRDLSHRANEVPKTLLFHLWHLLGLCPRVWWGFCQVELNPLLLRNGIVILLDLLKQSKIYLLGRVPYLLGVLLVLDLQLKKMNLLLMRNLVRFNLKQGGGLKLMAIQLLLSFRIKKVGEEEGAFRSQRVVNLGGIFSITADFL
mmetsp:Transcript_7273/g.9876  ORF Transcript_7273/g.9876 Transcript_7273/m.9876 type:complete len:351 (+) Transcript_7273:3382-4434(+)